MVKASDILNQTWELIQKVGEGTFSQIFVARNVIEDDFPLVAIKVMSDKIESSIIRWEGDVLANFNGSVLPKFYCHENHEGTEFLVMELLGGEDMAHFRDRIFQQSGSKLMSLAGASYLARQILQSIKSMHERGFIHRDIKPANFVRRTYNSTEFCVIDFGITKQVLNDIYYYILLELIYSSVILLGKYVRKEKQQSFAVLLCMHHHSLIETKSYVRVMIYIV